MLAEAAGVSKIIIACGRTDLRKGIDGLAQLVGTKYDMNPFEKNVLFLFCGGRGDRIKGLLWEGNGFLLLYKRLEDGSFSCGLSSNIDPLFRLNLTHPDVFLTWVSFFIISDFYTVF